MGSSIRTSGLKVRKPCHPAKAVQILTLSRRSTPLLYSPYVTALPQTNMRPRLTPETELRCRTSSNCQSWYRSQLRCLGSICYHKRTDLRYRWRRRTLPYCEGGYNWIFARARWRRKLWYVRLAELLEFCADFLSIATSSQVTGQVFAADYSGTTPSALDTATNNVVAAYNDARGRTATDTNVGGGEIGGLTFLPGVHAYTTAITASQDVTLAGACGDVFIFKTEFVHFGSRSIDSKY